MLIQFLLVDEPITYIKTHIKDIFGGIGAGALVFAIFIGIYYYLNIGLFFISQGSDITNSTYNALVTPNKRFNLLGNFKLHSLLFKTRSVPNRKNALDRWPTINNFIYSDHHPPCWNNIVLKKTIRQRKQRYIEKRK